MVDLDWKAVLAIAGIGLLIAIYAEKKAAAVAQALNPANNDNVINQGANSVVQAVTGGQSLSVGDWLYSISHPGG